MVKVIINSDDFGYSRGINHGIIDAHREGVLTSTTLMTNTPGFNQAIALSKEHPKLGIGVHLTLTFLKPLSGKINSLTNDKGDFHKLSVYENPNFQIDLEELYQEWDFQIKKVIDSGIIPTHLDSHHHLHTFGRNQEVVIQLANQYNLPVRGNFEKKSGIKTTDYFVADFDPVGAMIQNNQIEEADHYIESMIKKIKQYNTVEIMCHAGYIDQFLKTHTAFDEPRIFQTDFLIDSIFVDKIKSDSSIELVTYKEV
ncbi:carbohydrate deacetylase [Marinilactibacillus sp. GCM10026970]|uniref:carbohydrate deacetylase n=1 Tax=Marinilactibacillus sp. GCM10026970 TaxID=3252642 RepID=UPI00361F042E